MAPRTKKSPTSPTAKQIDAEPKMKTPEGGSEAILPPDDLRLRVAALEKALSIFLVHSHAAFLDAQDVADRKTKKVLADIEDRLAAGATFARVLLPEEAHDEAFEAWEALPKPAPARLEGREREAPGAVRFARARPR